MKPLNITICIVAFIIICSIADCYITPAFGFWHWIPPCTIETILLYIGLVNGIPVRPPLVNILRNSLHTTIRYLTLISTIDVFFTAYNCIWFLPNINPLALFVFNIIWHSMILFFSCILGSIVTHIKFKIKK